MRHTYLPAVPYKGFELHTWAATGVTVITLHGQEAGRYISPRAAKAAITRHLNRS